MNKYVRAFFMPIMIVAGIFTGFMCALIIAPIALVHFLRQIGYDKDDLEQAKKHREQELEDVFGTNSCKG